MYERKVQREREWGGGGILLGRMDVYFSLVFCVLKMHIHKSVYKPTLIYGSESWTVLDKHDSRIADAEMRFLGAAAGKTKWDRERNVTITEELKHKPIVEQIRKESYNGTDM
jgi:hypothetical protein